MNVYSLLTEIQTPAADPVYAAKMLHTIPDVPTVKRFDYLLERATGKVILDIGCTGPFSPELARVAREYHGIDTRPTRLPNFYQLDIETIELLPKIPDLELVIASEIIEHLLNAGRFLALLKQYTCPILLTTPNAFSQAGRKHLAQGVECVNRDHVSWYSYHTLKTLLERMEYNIINWMWYNGEPLIAEGLIFEITHGAD